MYIFNEKRVNIFAPFISEDGTRYDLTIPEHRKLAGVIFLEDPQPPEDYSEELYARFEQDEAPYVVYAPRTPEEVAQIRRARIAPVSKFQARAALHFMGLLDEVEALMEHPDTPMIAKLAWLHAQEFRRDSPTVLAMSNALGLTEEQLDQLFHDAAQIVA